VMRWRTVVHETLVAEARCFHSTAFYITPRGEYLLAVPGF
jgi:hypothetical protein